jgi:hypothetical protein
MDDVEVQKQIGQELDAGKRRISERAWGAPIMLLVESCGFSKWRKTSICGQSICPPKSL